MNAAASKRKGDAGHLVRSEMLASFEAEDKGAAAVSLRIAIIKREQTAFASFASSLHPPLSIAAILATAHGIIIWFVLS